jgi:uncharacterized protein YegP (UPF0339 family)
MASKFEIYQSEKSKEFYFRLKAANGQVVLASQGYKDKAGAKNGADSVGKHATDSKNFEKKESSSGKFFFNLKAKNGQVIGSSQMYASASSRDAGIKAVANAASGAAIADLTS